MNKVERFGMLPPIENAELVAAQMRAAHAYRNKLVEIERERRERMRKLDTEHATILDLVKEVTTKKELLEAAINEVKQVRRRASTSGHGVRAESKEQRENIRNLRKDLRVATKVWRDKLREVRGDSAIIVARDALNEEFLARRRQARGECGAEWGTYQLIEDADQAARRAPLWDGDEPNNPRFQRWNGEGAVSVQLVGGIDVPELVQDTQVRIDEAPWVRPGSTDSRNPESKRTQRCKRVVLWLRVGSDEKKKPIWAKWPMLQHRPFPDGTRIKRATVSLRYIGPRPEWAVTFVIEFPNPVQKIGGRVAGMDIGWRQRTAGDLRVAMVCEHGQERSEFALPARIISGIHRASTLRSTRDKILDEVRPKITKWFEDRLVLPQELRDYAENMHQWKAQARFAALAVFWRTHRFKDDADGFDMLEAWRKRDKHLWLWETSQRTGALRRRRDYYRNYAAHMAETYTTLFIEKFDLRAFARKAPTEAEKSDNEVARSNRFIASLSEFRSCLTNAFKARGGRVIEVGAENTTQHCPECGSTTVEDPATAIMLRCANHHVWDQDEGAASNILERGLKVLREREVKTVKAIEPEEESRWQRAKRMRKDKTKRMEAV